jgi:hypothetical protein
MWKNKKLTVRIEKWLADKGSANTSQIYDFANSKGNGITTKALGNLLSKHPSFEKAGVETVQGIVSPYEVIVWKLSDSKVSQND